MAKTTTVQAKPGIGTDRAQVLDRIEKLPSLSNVVGEFLELAKREYFTAKDFEKVISKDQALVARLLKVANTTQYSGSRTVRTIPEAVVLVGLDNMKKIVYAVSSEGLLRQELKCYCYPEMGYWRHSMGTAMISRTLAEAAGDCVLGGEEAFVAGLIHDVGKLILDDFLDENEGIREVSVEEEVAACGIDHADLAQEILQRWGIPDAIQEAVRYHHQPRNEDGWNSAAVIVSLADTISGIWGIGTQPLMDLGEEIDPARFTEQLAAVKLPEKRFEQILWDVRQKLVVLDGLFDEED